MCFPLRHYPRNKSEGTTKKFRIALQKNCLTVYNFINLFDSFSISLSNYQTHNLWFYIEANPLSLYHFHRTEKRGAKTDQFFVQMKNKDFWQTLRKFMKRIILMRSFRLLENITPQKEWWWLENYYSVTLIKTSDTSFDSNFSNLRPRRTFVRSITFFFRFYSPAAPKPCDIYANNTSIIRI